jgi:hypothetical protein
MNNIPETQKVVDALATNRVLWVRTFAPMRRVLAGMWTVTSGDAGLKLSLDGEGHFKLNNASAGIEFDGRYAIARIESTLYLVLDSQSVCYVLRIEDIQANSLKLAWVDDSLEAVRLEREQALEAASTRLRLL